MAKRKDAISEIVEEIDLDILPTLYQIGATLPSAQKKRRPPLTETKWLGFFFIKKVLDRPVPKSKIAVVAVPDYDHNAKPHYFLLDATSGVTPRIKKNMVIPITRVKFGDSCSYLAE
ncbi:hypothetical protein HY413_00585 [Candidatus Kaiserbacteria bacterium]|nr:hypothetical protein [Candidatus Kaiserbacteria bacterium]